MNDIQLIYADRITDPIEPARTSMDREALDDLANSIRSLGLINPITVRPVGDKYEVVAGHRRFRACMIAGIVQIPCVVAELDDSKTFQIRAHENLFRADLNPVEEALNVGRAVGDDISSIPRIARELNRSVAWIEDRLAILTYPDYLIAALAESKISLGVAKWLARIEDEVYRKTFVGQATANGLAVWQAEYYFRQWENGLLKEGATIVPPPEGSEQSKPVKIIVRCEKCGGDAESPNFRAVFIHQICPVDDVAPSV